MAFRKNKKFIDPRYFMDEKTDIIKEELESVLNEAHPRDPGGFMGMHIGGATAAPQGIQMSSEERLELQAEAERGIEAEGMDWILDSDIAPPGLPDVTEFLIHLEAASPEEYRLKVKKFLNDHSGIIGVQDFGDDIYGES